MSTIRPASADIGIFRDKLLAFPRNMTPAGDHLTNAIAAGMGVDSGTAENYKREYGEVIFGQQPQMTPGRLAGDLAELMAKPEQLATAAEAARRVGRPDAAERLADLVVRVATGAAAIAAVEHIPA